VVNREAVYQALFARVSAATWGAPPVGFAYAGRRVRLLDDLPAKPALCQGEHGEEVERLAGRPPRRWLLATLIIHHVTGDPDTPGATVNNLILDALDQALRPDGPDGCCTLGGLVAHAAIDGEIEKDPGDLDGRARLAVPVRLLAP
jgi:hypothetical protein